MTPPLVRHSVAPKTHHYQGQRSSSTHISLDENLGKKPKEQTILCKTKGQPITLRRVVRPRKDTQTKRKRTHLVKSLGQP